MGTRLHAFPPPLCFYWFMSPATLTNTLLIQDLANRLFYSLSCLACIESPSASISWTTCASASVYFSVNRWGKKLLVAVYGSCK